MAATRPTLGKYIRHGLSSIAAIRANLAHYYLEPAHINRIEEKAEAKPVVLSQLPPPSKDAILEEFLSWKLASRTELAVKFLIEPSSAVFIQLTQLLLTHPVTHAERVNDREWERFIDSLRKKWSALTPFENLLYLMNGILRRNDPIKEDFDRLYNNPELSPEEKGYIALLGALSDFKIDFSIRSAGLDDGLTIGNPNAIAIWNALHNLQECTPDEIECPYALFLHGKRAQKAGHESQATPFFEKAARLGNGAALYMLGQQHISGVITGCQPDADRGYQYCFQAGLLPPADHRAVVPHWSEKSTVGVFFSTFIKAQEEKIPVLPLLQKIDLLTFIAMGRVFNLSWDFDLKPLCQHEKSLTAWQIQKAYLVSTISMLTDVTKPLLLTDLVRIVLLDYVYLHADLVEDLMQEAKVQITLNRA